MRQAFSTNPRSAISGKGIPARGSSGSTSLRAWMPAVKMQLHASLVASALFGLSGCFGNSATIPADELPTLQEKRHSIREAVQTLNLSAEQTYSSTLEVLRYKNIPAIEADISTGSIKTDWVPMSDSLCGIYPNTRAPLPCNTQYTINISRFSPVASTFKISYIERCTSQSELFLDCPNSNAEKLMLDIIETLKATHSIVDENDF